MMALVGTFAYEFQVVLPVLASHTLHGGARAYGFMTASLGSERSEEGWSPPPGATPASAR